MTTNGHKHWRIKTAEHGIPYRMYEVLSSSARRASICGGT